MIDPLLTIRQKSGSYPYYQGDGVASALGSLLDRHAPGRTPVLVVGEALDRLHGPRLRAALPAARYLTVADGEVDKNFRTVEDLLAKLVGANIRRDSVVVAVGGGVVGDLVGFVSAIYLRGVDLVHVPTTLLAQVDSSVGGKVAVNLASGKNLVGAFHLPRAVIADVSFLESLPAQEFRSGMYEALKCGVIADPALFDLISRRLLGRDHDYIAEVVARSVAVKAKIVESDERESGVRRHLNYGHTVGHAIEVVTHYELLTHGDAIAWGMIVANRVATARGLLDGPTAATIDAMIMRLEPAALPKLRIDELIEAMDRDKKFTARHRVMVLPVRVGECTVVEDVTLDEVRQALSG